MSLACVGGDLGSAGRTRRSNRSSGAHTAAGVQDGARLLIDDNG